MITIALPAERMSKQLDLTLNKLEQTVTHYTLSLLVDSSVNVSEARQYMMANCKDQYICFIDYDTEIIDPYWLTKMMITMVRQDAAVVFCNELWGTSNENISNRFDINKELDDHKIAYGPAACMLVNLAYCKNIPWDPYIGLRNGWLGGDVEEVDFCYKVGMKGHSIYRCMDTAFHHTGGKTNINCYCGTDRGKTAAIMLNLLDYKYRKCPHDAGFFKGLNYIKAKESNDLMAESGHLRECYHDVIVKNGLAHIIGFKKRGLV